MAAARAREGARGSDGARPRENGSRDERRGKPSGGAEGRARPSGEKKERDLITFPFPSDELLTKGLAELSLTALADRFDPVAIRDPESIERLLKRYIRELELFNAAFDLVGAETGTERGRADLVVRHILDSLAPWKEIARELSSRESEPSSRERELRVPVQNADAMCAKSAESTGVPLLSVTLADAGSGAGFPGIPLAILFPNVRVTLIERMTKRCAFLENCVAILELSNVTVLNVEVEKAPRGAYDVIAFRAFRPLDREMALTLLALARDGTHTRDGSRSANAGGCLAAWKAREEKIREEMEGIADMVGPWEMRRVSVPFLGHEERNLVVIGKSVETPR